MVVIEDENGGLEASDTEQNDSGNQFGKRRESGLPLKYKLPFYGRAYRAWSRFIHKHGYHYAPVSTIPVALRKGLSGNTVREYSHWCHWCGLRGTTIDITDRAKQLLSRQSATDAKANNGVRKNALPKENKTNEE